MSVDSQVTQELEAAMEQWTDMRVMHVDDLYDLLLFHSYGQKVLSQNGLTLMGHQVRRKNGQWLLTVKVTQNDTPLIAYITSGTPTGCIRLFVTQLETDRLRWSQDRYPWI
ncbi:MAG: hypothetical protein WBF29_20740 [Syntrophobacteria bacterium]